MEQEIDNEEFLDVLALMAYRAEGTPLPIDTLARLEAKGIIINDLN